MKIELSNTIKNIPENVFYPIFKLISEESSNGNPLLNAGIGVPDSDTPELLLKELEIAIRKPENMRYGAFDGKVTLLNEISQWLKEKYNINIISKPLSKKKNKKRALWTDYFRMQIEYVNKNGEEVPEDYEVNGIKLGEWVAYNKKKSVKNKKIYFGIRSIKY